jgi:hypothetical protein
MLAAGAAIAALSIPAVAQDHGRGGGEGAGGPGGGGPPGIERNVPVPGADRIPGGANANDHAFGQVQGDVHAQTYIHANDRAHERTGANVDHSTNANNKGAASGASANVRSNNTTHATPNYGGDVCPPGLSSRNPACVPPGQANRTFTVGQRLSSNFRYYTDVSNIPAGALSQVPSQYQTDAYRYIYQTDRIYVVDRNTNTVVTVVNLNP